MCIGVQDFQKKAAQILAQLDKTKTKNIEFVGIRMGLDEIKKMIEENLDAFEFIPRMNGWESELNYASLSNCQKIREKLERNLKNSLGICTKLHKEAIILFIKWSLPQIGKMGQPKPDEQLHEKLEVATHSIEKVVKIP